MTVFDDIVRAGNDPPTQGEAAFAYLNRSGRVEARKVRELVDTWFTHYPASHRDGLVARFRSDIDDQHKSAFFELFLHEMVLTRGHRVLAIEPSLPHTTKSPDFLVQTRLGDRFYLEAVIATGRSQAETAAEARLNQALAAIDNTPSSAHFLDLHTRGMPTAPVSIRKMKRALSDWIETLPDDQTANDRPPFVYEEHGLRLTLHPFPRHNRTRVGRAIGARHFPVRIVTIDNDIRTALEKKASRYGELDQPYVVAVNSLGLFHRDDHAFDALLGTPVGRISENNDGSLLTDEVRKPDGVWQGSRGPRKRGLSAVLSTDQIDPWNFASRRGLLIRNPWAATILPPVDLGIDEANPDRDEFRTIDGANMATIFGLPHGWPQD
jgi:hypothetical protein